MNKLCLKDIQTALHLASRVGDADTVELLISQGASLNAVTSDGYTPLHIAAKEGHDDVVHLLLDHGVPSAPTTKASHHNVLNHEPSFKKCRRNDRPFYPHRLYRSAWVGVSSPSVCLFVCCITKKTNDPKVFKLGIGNVLGIS